MSSTGKNEDGTRNYDLPTPLGMAEFMKQGWAPTPLVGIKESESARFCRDRRTKLSNEFFGTRLVIPAGALKVRSNDTDYRFRAHSAFSWLTGISASESVPESVLVMEPRSNGHEALLYIHPRSTRDSDEFYRDATHGEFWVGRRMTTEETEKRFGIKVMHLDTLPGVLRDGTDTVVLRGHDKAVDKRVEKHKKREKALDSWLSAARLVKDSYEINEMQKAVDATARGFVDIVKAIPAATSVKRGERIIEAAFFGRARLEGNELGYDTIAAAGSHACILHWIKNDGDVRPGDLMLVDAGIEMESHYTADITRTLPINGKFTPAQRHIYTLVYEAQKAGFNAVKAGAKFKDINDAAQSVLAQGLAELGVLPVSVGDSLKEDGGYHRRWSVHGTSHMLGMDVHDCAKARNDQYRDGILEAGMILTVEPGLYIHPDDELFPAEYRGIGVRIEDDVLVTNSGYQNLSRSLPSHPDEVEVWMANILRQ